MLAALLVVTALPLAGPADSPASPDFAAYEAAKANVGRDPDAHVRLALWCEAHGLQAERLKHLAIAVIANPRHSVARGLMGLVDYHGRWQRPESISENAKNDALLAEYRDRRAKTKDDPDAQWALALWCDDHGLKAEAAAHFTAVVKRDPKRDAAWKRLGFKKQGLRWVTDAQLAEEKAEADRQKQADRHWKPLLEKWRDGLGSKSGKRRAEVETALSEMQLESDVATLERSNAQTRELNGRMAQLLNETTVQDLAADRTAWQGWWLDQLGFAQKRPYEQPKPTVVEVVSRPLPPVAGFEENEDGYSRRISCFGAGTPVHTLSGVQPIESLKEGDRVLTLDTKTGALGYRPILVVHRNPPSPTYRIALGDETVVSSDFHRFWKAGQGWVMARDLAPGDTVRTLGGLVPVKSIDASDVQPVFNLDVAEDADFFVGRQGALVHDNTLPDLRQAPFDAPPSLATAD